MHVVNHCEGKPTEEKRNILQESARIARGDVTDLAELDASAFDAAIIPGEICQESPQSEICNAHWFFLHLHCCNFFERILLCFIRGIWCGQEPE